VGMGVSDIRDPPLPASPLKGEEMRASPLTGEEKS
jgi:hypothetical protein